MRRLLLWAAILCMAAPGLADAQSRGRKSRRGKRARPAPRVPAPEPAPTPDPPPEPAPAPAAPAPAEAAPAEAPALDVDSLRQEYLSLRDQLFRSRARAAAVASAVYSSKLRIQLDYGSARFYTVTRATIRLDGANVYDDAQGAIAADRAPRWDGFVAPGRHLVTVRIEATGKDDPRFTTSLESSFAVQAPAGKDVVVKCAAQDEGDIAYQWQRSEQGSYRLRLDVAIATSARAEGRGGVKRARR
jgi:hypothetical protein